MNTTEWITDRLPTAEDAPNTSHRVWHTNEDGYVVQRLWQFVQLGEPWMRLQMPAPYVKPKRCNAEWSENNKCWAINCYTGTRLERVYQWALTHNDEHREAAELIAAIYEEVMP
jgi:transposase